MERTVRAKAAKVKKKVGEMINGKSRAGRIKVDIGVMIKTPRNRLSKTGSMIQSKVIAGTKVITRVTLIMSFKVTSANTERKEVLRLTRALGLLQC